MRKSYVLLVFLVSLTVFTFLKLQPIALVAFSPPSMELVLTKSTYSPDEPLDGYISLSFQDKFDTASPIILSLGDQSISMTLPEILNSLGRDYSSSEASTSITNPETAKTLTFSSAETKELAFSVPKGAVIESLNFDIIGQDPKPKSPIIDLNLDDSTDWVYKGEFSSWSLSRTSDGLDISKETSSAYITGNQYLYCDLIYLPSSKEFNISIKYTKEFGSDLKATILRLANTASFVKPNTFCTLPITPTSDWSSCIFNLDEYISGEYLVCVYTTAVPSEGIKYFKLITDDESPKSGYQCDLAATNQGAGTCTKTADYFIKIYTAQYEKELTSSTFLDNSLKTPQETAEYLTDYVATCTEDECPIPFSISTASEGKIILQNLKLDYLIGQSAYSVSRFYNLGSIEKAAVYEIDGEDITDQELKIPLSLFGLLVPSVLGDSETMQLKATVGSEQDFKPVTIYQYGPPASVSLEKAKTILNNLIVADEDTLLILGVMGMEPSSTLTKLQEYETQLNSLDPTMDTTQQKTEINLAVNDILNNLPTYIAIKGKVNQQHIPQLSDITDNLLEESQINEEIKTEIYVLQEKASIQSTSINFFMTNYAGVQEEKTLISKKILNPLGNINIIEKIPKSIVASSDDLIISGDYMIIEKDPIIKFRGSATTETINYLVSGNILDQVADTVTLLIPVDLTVESSIKFECGDGVCTSNVEDAVTCPQDCTKKMPWLVIFILLAIVVVAVWYFNFYRGEWTLRKLVEKRRKKKEIKQKEKKFFKPDMKIEKPKEKLKFFKKQPLVRFNTEADKINLKTYITKSLEKNIPRQQINKLLLQQGWSQQQIDLIYRELKK